MKSLKYQQTAVKELVEKAMRLMSLSGSRHTLVFKAPTGAGKTVMASEMLMRLNEEIPYDPKLPYNEVAFIWIAPNKLHQQSYFKMKSFFTETKGLRPVIYDDIDHSTSGFIHAGEILFVNWESINKDNAIIVRDSEQNASLYDLTRRTQEEQGIPIIVIIDEEHLFAGRLANKSETVLKKIDPKVEIRISATPSNEHTPNTPKAPDAFVNIPREEVIAEGMIKEGVVLNPALDFNSPNSSLNQHLIHLALQKREELAEAYRKLGVNINPLLLIQLPNDGSEKMTDEDESVRKEVVEYLDLIKGISTANGKLAVWLSAEKANLDGIERFDNPTEVLLFKQAIAMGWDCPRAAVLLIFREIKSFTFTAQTVGRILRMPEQHFYEDDILNKGYVYTNLSKDIIKIVNEDMDYLSSLHAVRREGLCNVVLQSEFCERPAESRKRLGADFKKVLSDCFCEKYSVKNTGCTIFTSAELDGKEIPQPGKEARENQQVVNRRTVGEKLKFAIQGIGIDIVDDQTITGEVGTVSVEKKVHYVRTTQELSKAFFAFCSKSMGARFEKVSIATLGYALKEVLYGIFGLEETDAIKMVLYHGNRPKIEAIVGLALDRYYEILKKRQTEKSEKSFEKYDWEVPADRLYKEDTHFVREDVKDHALLPFIQLQKASCPEKHFVAFLEKNKKHIDWWYKNGDAGKQHYAISYTDIADRKSLFYVDFVIRMKSGRIFLFDTKTTGSDPNAARKHNALIDYIDSEEGKKINLGGGIIIEDGDNWKYSKAKISDTLNTSEWECFYPDEN